MRSKEVGTPLGEGIRNDIEKGESVQLTLYVSLPIQDDPKLLGDSGAVPIFEWSAWRFDSCCEIFSLLDGKKLVK